MWRQLKNLRRRASRHADPETTLRGWLAMTVPGAGDRPGWVYIRDEHWREILRGPVPPVIERPAGLPGEIWGVTCHFNPAGFAIKREVYRRFRESTRSQGLKLLAVELSPSGNFELSDIPGDDAEVVIRLTEGDPIWQKERLLNIAIDALPPGVDKVIWVDADLIFDNPRWVADTAEQLQQFPIIQCYRDCVRLGQATDLQDAMARKHTFAAGVGEERRQLGFVAAMRQNQLGHTGFVWAARRSLLDKHGLYDANVIGCGDAVMAYAIRRQMYTVESMRSPAYDAHAEAWMQRFADDVEHSAGFTSGTVFHLWHGDAKFRGYGNRTRRFGQTAFDPRKDLRLTSQKTWAWSDAVLPETRRTVARYFRSRREDGGPVVFPTWILAHPRSGSTWLCELLNATGAFAPKLMEWHNPAAPWTEAMPDAMPFPRHVKFQPVHDRRKFTLADVAKRIADVGFVLCRRRDLVAAATSLYIVRETGGTWHLADETQRQAWLGKTIEIDDRRLLAAYREIRRNAAYWPAQLERHGLKPAMTVWYEDLLADPRKVIQDVLGIVCPAPGSEPAPSQPESSGGVIRQQRPESEAIYQRLTELTGGGA